LIQLFVQTSVVFIYVMEALKARNGAFTPALLPTIGFIIVSVVIITRLKDLVYRM
jgi:hypothetical protein